MKRTIWFAALSALVVASLAAGCRKSPPTSAPAGPQEEQRAATENEARKFIVARVNGAGITMASLVDMMNRLGPPSKASGPVDGAKKAALDRLVFQELVVQQARAAGIAPDPNQVDAAIRNLKENLGGEKEYQDYLRGRGVTEQDLRADVERSLTREIMFKREVIDKIVLPEDEIRAEYEREKGRYIKPEKVTVIDVDFFLKPGDPGAMKKARSVLRKVRADKDRDPWRLVLDGTFQVRTLSVAGEKHPDLYAAARKMKVGQLSDVIKTPDSLHIIKLKEYEPERQYTLEEARGVIEGKFRVRAQDKRIREWEEELRRTATIEIMDEAPAAAAPRS